MVAESASTREPGRVSYELGAYLVFIATELFSGPI